MFHRIHNLVIKYRFWFYHDDDGHSTKLHGASKYTFFSLLHLQYLKSTINMLSKMLWKGICCVGATSEGRILLQCTENTKHQYSSGFTCTTFHKYVIKDCKYYHTDDSPSQNTIDECFWKIFEVKVWNWKSFIWKVSQLTSLILCRSYEVYKTCNTLRKARWASV